MFVGPQNSTLAIISMIMGIIGLTVIPVVGSIVAVITGYMRRNEIKNSSGQIKGDGFAIVGLIMGYIGVAVGVLIIGMFILGFVVAINSPHMSSLNDDIPVRPDSKRESVRSPCSVVIPYSFLTNGR